MPRKWVVPVLLLGVLAALAIVRGRRPRLERIILISVDALRPDFLGAYNPAARCSPNIDRFAAESVRFTQAYAMSVCTPTRATLMTGKHAARLRMTIWSEGALAGPKNRQTASQP